jgi:transcriptional regulator with XRE-family HTH domain
MEPDQLRDFRLKHKLTQAKLAELLMTTGNTVARWERGERAIPPYLALALQAIESELSKSKKN